MAILPTSAEITSNSATGISSGTFDSIVRVVCESNGSQGTGFLHTEDIVVTADHVVKGTTDCSIWTTKNVKISGKVIASDAQADLAAIKLDQSLSAPRFALDTSSLVVGEDVATWGFPAGYTGLNPMLTMGTLAGADRPGGGAFRIVVNAAFNSGNSGGPLFRAENGEIIGVVVSKLAPVPPYIEAILKALENQQSGFQHTFKDANGNTHEISEGQLIGTVLKFLREQTQLVVGHATQASDLAAFLTKNSL